MKRKQSSSSKQFNGFKLPKSNGQRSSMMTDNRPIRDIIFQNNAREKIISFLMKTDFLTDSFTNLFRRMSTNDFKNIFEHFVKLMSPLFRLNEFKNVWQPYIINFFLTFKHKSNLTGAHITSPTLASSAIFIVASLDFLRRLTRAYINTYADMMFPKIEVLRISTECLVRSVIKLRKDVNNGQFDTLQDTMDDLRKELQKKAGVMTDEEKSEREKRLNHFRDILNKESSLLTNIEQLDTLIVHMEVSMEENRKIIKTKKMTNKHLTMEIENTNEVVHSKITERNVLKLDVDRFGELGYDDTLAQLNEQKEKLAQIKTTCKDWKTKVDIIGKEVRMIETELDLTKLNAQQEIIVVQHLMSDELHLKLSNFEMEDLLKYDTVLRPLLDTFNDSIELEIKSQLRLNVEKGNVCEVQDVEYISLLKEVEKVRVEETRTELMIEESVVESNKGKRTIETTMEENEEEWKIVKGCEEIWMQLEDENAETEARLAFERQQTLDAKDFYEADIEFREGIAEVELDALLSDLVIHEAILKQRNDRIKKDLQFAEELNLETDKLEKEAIEFYSMELDRLKRDNEF